MKTKMNWIGALNEEPNQRKSNRIDAIKRLRLLALLCCSVSSAIVLTSAVPGYATPSHEQDAGNNPDAPFAPGLGNYPNASIMLSANTTLTPTAAPTSTTRITVSTSTNFHGRLEGIPATGVVRVTDAHPAGVYTITVRAFDSGGASVSKTFTLTVTTPPTCLPVGFAAAQNFTVGTAPGSVVVGDFNGDGKQDLATTNASSSNVSILLGNGAGSFGGATNFNTGNLPQGVAVGDFNGDGRQDLAVGRDTGNKLAILLSNGAGTFTNASNVNAGNNPVAVAVGDFNNDGKQDLAVANRTSNNVSILLGTGTGTFGNDTTFAVGTNPLFIVVGDFNADGSQDLAVANSSSDNVSILLGNGAGSFGAATNFPVGDLPAEIAVGDFNGDGDQDLAVANLNSGTVSILLGSSGGGFVPSGSLTAATPEGVAVGDFNGDGKQDLAVGHGAIMTIFPGNGAGGFGGAINVPLSQAAFSVAVGDFNGDGKQDIATANSNAGNVSVLLRNCGPLALGSYQGALMPLSSDTTVTPGMAPTNATGINVSTSTNFKGRLEADPLTGIVRVTNAHPAGTYLVKVEAFNGTDASATTSFNLTVTTPTICTPVSFDNANTFGDNRARSSIAVGDFNRDGKQDLAVANTDSNNDISVYAGTGNGGFGPATNFPVGSVPRSLAVGDFNNDGNEDLAAANSSSNDVSVLLGNGAGSFSLAPGNFATGLSPSSVAVGDFNGDGNQDLAVSNASPGDVSILLGDGTGNFGAATNFVAGSSPQSVAVGDFNQDGHQDLAVANHDSNNVSILLGNGAGGFSAPVNFAASTGPVWVAVGDFNRDGRQDLAVVRQTSNSVLILLGNGAGSFAAGTSVATGTSPGSVAVGDFDGDTLQDLAVTNISNDVSIFLCDVGAVFGEAINLATASSPVAVAIGDFNGDLRQDLAAVSSISNAPPVSVLLRNCMPQMPLVPEDVSSREMQGAAGSFDIEMPLTGAPGIECRSGGATNDFTMMVLFANPVMVTGSPQAQVTAGTAIIGTGGSGNGGAVSISDRFVIVPLTNVANAQTVTVKLNGVTDGATTNDVTFSAAFLQGDTTGDGLVNSGDIAQTKSKSGQDVDGTNFRNDVTGDGGINSADISLVKSKSGTALP